MIRAPSAPTRRTRRTSTSRRIRPTSSISCSKIRDGKQNKAIPVANITLSQAVETAWLYFFTGILAPINFALGMAPEFTDINQNSSPAAYLPLPAQITGILGSFLNYNTLVGIFFAGGQSALTILYSQTATALLNQCVARVTEEQKEAWARPTNTSGTTSRSRDHQEHSEPARSRRQEHLQACRGQHTG